MPALDELRSLNQKRFSNVLEKLYEGRAVLLIPNKSAHSIIPFQKLGGLQIITPSENGLPCDKGIEFAGVQGPSAKRLFE